MSELKILKDYQEERAEEYLKEHHSSVCYHVKNTYGKYPPSDSYDCNQPRYWKPEHWKWYLDYREALSV